MRVLESVLYAEDLDAVEPFYTQVMGLPLTDKTEGRHLFYRLGDSMLLIFQPEATRDQDVAVAGQRIPKHGSWGSGHLAFRVDHARLDEWRQRLHTHQVSIEQEIAWPNGAHSIYFRDPAHNSLEFATPDLWDLQ